MPPKRKAALAASTAITAPRQNLRNAFKNVSKATTTNNFPGKNEKPTVKGVKEVKELKKEPDMVLTPTTNSAMISKTTRTRATRRKVTIIEDGDEDVIPAGVFGNLKPKVEEVKVQEKVKEEVKKEVKEEVKKEVKEVNKPAPKKPAPKKAVPKPVSKQAAPSRKRRRGATPELEAPGPSIIDALLSGAKRQKANNVTTLPSPAAVTDGTDVTSLPTPPSSFTENQPKRFTEPSDDTNSYDTLPRLHRALLTALTLHSTTSAVAPLFTTISTSVSSLAHTPLTLPSVLRIVHLSPYLHLTSPPLRIHLVVNPPPIESQISHFLAALESYPSFEAIPEATPTKFVDKAAAVRKRGKGLLAEMKASASQKKAAGPQQLTLQQFGMKPVAKVRASNLLERIKAKEAVKKAEPTAEEKTRELARGRVPEVLEVLRGLRGSGSRGLAEVVEIIRGSVRMPVERGVAEVAVRLAAEDEGRKDGGGWVEVREVGGVAAVVLKREVGGRFA